MFKGLIKTGRIKIKAINELIIYGYITHFLEPMGV